MSENEKEIEEVSSPLKSMKEGLDDVMSQREKELDPIPWGRATIRKEYKKCRNVLCECNNDYPKPKKTHGPYLYAYWKDKGKLNKKYVGKSREEYEDKLRMKARNEITGKNWTFAQWNKYNFIELVAQCGSKVAQNYKRKFGIGSANEQLDEIMVKIFNELGVSIVMKHGRVPTIDWAHRIVLKEFRRNQELQRKLSSKINEQMQSGYSNSNVWVT